MSECLQKHIGKYNLRAVIHQKGIVMKIVVHPRYRHLSNLTENIVKGRISAVHTFCDHRNVVQKIEENGETLVVKRYKRPTWFNMLAYTFFRKSKARRSYEFALKLQTMGIETPDPVAYAEIRKNGLFHTGYFISKYIDYLPLSIIDTYPEEKRREILDAFARFTVSLHIMGVMHGDYSTSNILFKKQPDGYHFALIDINRMRFKRMTKRDCIRNFRRLGLNLNTLLDVICRYTRLRHWSETWTFASLLIYRNTMNALGKGKSVLKKWWKNHPMKPHYRF